MDSRVDAYIRKKNMYREELEILRNLCLETGLDETVKWGSPVYTLDGKNVFGIGAFKSYFGLWFFQGVFLSDPKNVLINAQEEKTKALRQMRFNDKSEIDVKIVRRYLREAVKNQEKGLEVKPERNITVPELPELLKSAFSDNPVLSKNFEQLTPGRKREYILYLSEAKREETRKKRLEKMLPLIERGVGLNDQYK